ncbi:hypothetical protein IAT38_003434 [Cryptococcus sp. DSM 104549]
MSQGCQSITPAEKDAAGRHDRPANCPSSLYPFPPLPAPPNGDIPPPSYTPPLRTRDSTARSIAIVSVGALMGSLYLEPFRSRILAATRGSGTRLMVMGEGYGLLEAIKSRYLKNDSARMEEVVNMLEMLLEQDGPPEYTWEPAFLQNRWVVPRAHLSQRRLFPGTFASEWQLAAFVADVHAILSDSHELGTTVLVRCLEGEVKQALEELREEFGDRLQIFVGESQLDGVDERFIRRLEDLQASYVSPSLPCTSLAPSPGILWPDTNAFYSGLRGVADPVRPYKLATFASKRGKSVRITQPIHRELLKDATKELYETWTTDCGVDITLCEKPHPSIPEKVAVIREVKTHLLDKAMPKRKDYAAELEQGKMKADEQFLTEIGRTDEGGKDVVYSRDSIVRLRAIHMGTVSGEVLEVWDDKVV